MNCEKRLIREDCRVNEKQAKSGTLRARRVLHLVLKGEYYDAIERGEKRCEYRDNTPYWRKRILEKDPNIVVFHRGYTNQTMAFWIAYKVVLPTQIEIVLGDRIDDWKPRENGGGKK